MQKFDLWQTTMGGEREGNGRSGHCVGERSKVKV